METAGIRVTWNVCFHLLTLVSIEIGHADIGNVFRPVCRKNEDRSLRRVPRESFE